MSTKSESCCSSQSEAAAKPGFFQRFWQKLDNKMKEKAEKQGSCCCGCEDEKAEGAEKPTSDKCC